MCVKCLIIAAKKYRRLAEKIQIGPGYDFRRRLKKLINKCLGFLHIFSILDAAKKCMPELEIGRKIEAELFKAP